MVLLVGAMAPAAVLVWAGIQHVVDPDALGAALRQPQQLRRVLGPQPARLIARLWGVVEIGTGVPVYLVLLAPTDSGIRLPVLLWLTLVYAGFAVWLLILRRQVPAATCGCGYLAEPANRLAVLRAVALGGCAAIPTLALLTGQQLAVPRYGWVALPVAAALALLVWIVPTAIRPVEMAR
jgi:hypothetical protein